MALRIGMQHEVSLTVEEEHTAQAFGAPGVLVLGTPVMIGLMERAAWEMAQQDAEPDMSTVGTLVQVRHLAATPVGDHITATARLLEMEGRKLTFAVSARDSKRLIGEGTHERMWIRLSRFLAGVS